MVIKRIQYIVFCSIVISCNAKITKAQIAAYLPSNPIVVEAGAADGTDTLEMSTLWPNGKIYAFEPVPGSFKKAQEKVAGKQNVYIFPYALSSKTGSAEFFVSSGMVGAQSSSLLMPHQHLDIYPQVVFKEKIKVPTIRLDEWALEADIDHIDLLWLDMQGAEFDTLYASPEIVQTVKVIMTEVNFIEMYKGCVLFDTYKSWLEALGFNLVAVDHKKTYGDALFVRK